MSRRRGTVLLASVLGGIAGAAGVAWWEGQHDTEARPPDPSASAVADVRLVLTGVELPVRSNRAGGDAAPAPLWIDGALLHSRGPAIATVVRIHRASGSVTIRTPALPVRLSANKSYEPVRLQITPRDCALATEWTPSAQPFTLTWRDEHGDVHSDTGGDHDALMELALIRYVDEVCDAHAPR